jgi:uncharacterized protein
MDKDIFQEREHALEEDYFRRKNQELIGNMKRRIAAEAHPDALVCPKCGGELHTGNYENVQIDVCDNCGGVWLDAGEMQKIVQKADKTWIERLFS